MSTKKVISWLILILFCISAFALFAVKVGLLNTLMSLAAIIALTFMLSEAIFCIMED